MNKENSNEPGEQLVPREFEIPKLTIKEIKSITKLVFKSCKPLNADILFVLGSSAGDWKSIADLFHHKLVSKIIVTGLTGKYYDRTGIPLAHNIKTELVKNKVPPSSIIVQDRSTNTLEDIRFAKEELDKRNIFPKSILFASKSHHSGRVFLTLKKYFLM